MAALVSFDASTLINFHNDGSAVLLARHFRGRSLVSAFIEEIELGAKAGGVVMDGSSRWIERVELSGAASLRRIATLQSLLGSKSRHRGEAEAIAICEAYGAILATDDDGAALVAQAQGLRVASTVDILKQLVARSHLSRDQALTIATRMQCAGQNVDASKI
jgi:predicted nucleic acid-binding protein